MGSNAKQATVTAALGFALALGGCRASVPPTPAHAAFGDMPVGATLAQPGSDAIEEPPFARLLARPELYHLKRIRLIGFVNLEFEGNALYHVEDEYRHSQLRDALWIDVEGMKAKPPFARGWVIVEGTFNGQRRGHFSAYAGTVEEITRLEAWRPQR